MTDTKTDFNFECKSVEFPFKEIVLNNEVYKKTLFTEFEALDPKPKLHLYLSEFISTHGDRNKLEARTRDICNEFNTLIINENVDRKYYGRYINDTETVKTLNEIANKIDAFNKYILTPSSINTFEGYATATALKIISLLDKIKAPGLKVDILNGLVNNSENIQITIAYLNNSESEQKELKHKYDILKTYADKVFNEEISRIVQTDTGEVDQIKSGLNFKSQFKNPAKYEEVFSILIANGNFRKDAAGELVYLGSPSPNKYGVEALRMVLNDLGYLKDQSGLKSQHVLEIHKNTFKGFFADTRTINNRPGLSKGFSYFLAVLNPK